MKILTLRNRFIIASIAIASSLFSLTLDSAQAQSRKVLSAMRAKEFLRLCIIIPAEAKNPGLNGFPNIFLTQAGLLNRGVRQ